VSQREHCRIPLKIKYGKEYVVRYLMRITEENDNDTCQLNQLSIKSIKFKYSGNTMAEGMQQLD